MITSVMMPMKTRWQLQIRKKDAGTSRKIEYMIPIGTPCDSHGSSLMEFLRYELLEKQTKGVTLLEIDPLTSGCPCCNAEQEVETAPKVDWKDMTAWCSFFFLQETRLVFFWCKKEEFAL